MKKFLAGALCALALAGCTGKGGGSAAGSGDTGGWKYDEHPTANMAPDAPVKGSANKQAVEFKGAYFEPGFKTWTLRLTESPLANPTDFAKPGEMFIELDLPEAPAAGKHWTKDIKYGDGFFQIHDPKDPKQLTSWNAENSYYVEITAWDVKPYDPAGGAFQAAGKASGKVYVAYKGGFGFENAGAAGSFKDVPVRYMGKPYWEQNGNPPAPGQPGQPAPGQPAPGLPAPGQPQQPGQPTPGLPAPGQTGQTGQPGHMNPPPGSHGNPPPGSHGVPPGGHGAPPGKAPPPGGHAAPGGHTPPPPPHHH